LQKRKDYSNIKFDSTTLAAADKLLGSMSSAKTEYDDLSVGFDSSEDWEFDTLAEFLAAADQEEYERALATSSQC
jgi:hypothetical protein